MVERPVRSLGGVFVFVVGVVRKSTVVGGRLGNVSKVLSGIQSCRVDVVRV